MQSPDFLHANVLSPIQLKEGIDGLKRVFDSLNTAKNRQSAGRFMLEAHLNGAISWLQSCIDNNKHTEKYEQFLKFNNTIEDMDK